MDGNGETMKRARFEAKGRLVCQDLAGFVHDQVGSGPFGQRSDLARKQQTLGSSSVFVIQVDNPNHRRRLQLHGTSCWTLGKHIGLLEPQQAILAARPGR